MWVRSHMVETGASLTCTPLTATNPTNPTNPPPLTQASHSLPGSPFHRRLSRVSAAGSHSWQYRSQHRFGERKLWLRSSYLDTQEQLPYMDDSRLASPEGSLDGTTVGGLLGYYTAALGAHSRNNSYSSHTSRVTYNSHAELTGRQGSRELHWRRSGDPARNCQWAESFLSSGDQDSLLTSPRYQHTGTAYPSNGNHNGANGGLRPDAGQPVTKQRLSVQFPVRSASELTHCN